jgi:leucyl aminopeptidase (aminopeptidase T)
MIELELSEISRTVVEELGEVEADDEVLVITDAQKVKLARAVASQARATGATTSLAVRPRSSEHSNEPPEAVSTAMMAVDVVFTVSTHSITHTDSVRNALDAGKRVVVLRGMTEEMMIEGGVNTDYEQLREDTRAVRDMLEAAEEAHVTSPEGTDVTFGITEHPALSLSGYAEEHSSGGLAGLPPGEAPIAPDQDSADGRIVIDYSMDNIGRLEDPIEMDFEAGYVQEVSGGPDATRLRKILKNADENAGHLAEFAIGTNPDSRLIGNLAEDKKKRGTIHFAIGDNGTLGGSRPSDIHLDGVILHPTVRIDGNVILEEGEELQMDVMRELAGN